jgi:hypothetical protein
MFILNAFKLLKWSITRKLGISETRKLGISETRKSLLGHRSYHPLRNYRSKNIARVSEA